MASIYQYLSDLKTMNNFSGSYFDDMINLYAQEVIEFMLDSGVSKEVCLSESAKGTIAKGIMDIWNNDGGKTEFSPYFRERVVQLSYKSKVLESTDTSDIAAIANAAIYQE